MVRHDPLYLKQNRVDEQDDMDQYMLYPLPLIVDGQL